MLQSIKSIHGYSIHATDGELGKLHDIFFDDQEWMVRYFVVDTGTLISGRKVLLFPIALARPDWKRHAIPVGLSKERILESPPIESDKPVSRQHEKALYEYFALTPYWPVQGVPYGSVAPVLTSAGLAEPDSQNESGDPHLRSAREVTGYHVQAVDGAIGRMDDLILDVESWNIRYMVVKTGTWLFGNKVLVPPSWITRVSWNERKVFCDVSTPDIKNAPDYDPQTPVNRDYEIRYYDYYGRPKYF